MQHHQIASLTRSAALMACLTAALMLALAGSASAIPGLDPHKSEPAQQPTQLSENSGQQAQPQTPRGAQLSEHGGQQAQTPVTTSQIVGDSPSDRVSPTAGAPADGSSTSTSSSSDAGNDSAPLIVGLSLLTVALLGTAMYTVRRRRHVAPGH